MSVSITYNEKKKKNQTHTAETMQTSARNKHLLQYYSKKKHSISNLQEYKPSPSEQPTSLFFLAYINRQEHCMRCRRILQATLGSSWRLAPAYGVGIQ